LAWARGRDGAVLVAGIQGAVERRDFYIRPPEAFGKMLAGEIARWGKVIREANVKVQ